MLEITDYQALPNVVERTIYKSNVNTYEDVLQAIVLEIHSKMPRLLTLNQFFQTYDIYVGRMFYDWEIELIFPQTHQYLKPCFEELGSLSTNKAISLQKLLDDLYTSKAI